MSPRDSGEQHGRYRYAPWSGGPDPLAPPFDVRSALDEVGHDVLSGGSLREALRELMRRGMDGHRGLDDLGDHAWHSPEAQQTYEQIQQMLQREVVGAQFEGLKQALSGNDPQAMQAVKDMLADLNQLLAAHARDEDTEDQFRDFMDKHGDLFPEHPENVDELIDALARRQAAADRLMASLTPEQREQLGQLMSDALGDPDLASQMAQLSDNLRALRPGLDRRSPVQPGQGGEPMGYGDAVGAVAELADLEQLGEGYFGATLDDVDVERLEQYLGADAARDMEALRQLERELERQGYVSRGDDGLRLTPRAVRRLGETALKRVFERVEAAGRGDHDDRAAGQADELTGLSRPWEFGDELPIDTVRTVSNALQRNARGGGRVHSTGGVELLVEDFEVAETERRSVAAVALCVDMSFSMLQEGRWGPMKQTALALSHLVQTRFRHDALQIIGFNLAARRLTPVELAEAEPEWVQGTNLQHALMLASRHLRRHPDAEPVVLVVTDGEPTAHIESDGRPSFHWPATQETVRATVAQVDELRRSGAQLNIFMLGEDPGLARFVDAVARRAGGRVFTPDVSRLGEYVVADYLRTRRGRR